MTRSLTTRNLFDKRTGRTVRFQSPLFERAIGDAERKGIWLIYGPEKNGKTWFTLQLARDLAVSERVRYISAEEGTDKSFQDACRRAGITPADRIIINEYIPAAELDEMLSKGKQPRIVFLDNLVVYQDELKGLGLRLLSERHPDVLFVCVAHEERREPYPASARMAKKLAKVYVHIQGLKAFVVSRFAPQGGEIIINDDLSEMYWGEETI
ncbi:MAG: hypothetical protein ABFD76_16570 [Smithella sp.]